MARKFVTLGSMVNMHLFDDTGPSAYAIITDSQLSVATQAANPTEVLRLADIGTLIGDVVGPAGATDNAICRFDTNTGKLIQNSLVTINNAGSISLPGGQTVDGVDISVHASNNNAHHAQVHTYPSHSDVNMAGLANDDLAQYDDPSSSWQAKDIAEIILGQDINPGQVIVGVADNEKILFGEDEDASIYYDGTDLNIKTDEVAPSDLLIDCGADKTIELQEEVWDDIRINPGSFDRPGQSDPTFQTFTPSGAGTSTYLYEFAKNDIVSFTVQLPHKYKHGEDIGIHLHWTPGNWGVAENGNLVGWKVDYSWANIDGTFGAMATADLSDACDGTDDKHQIVEDVMINGAGKTISSMLVCNLKRTDTGADDTWASNSNGEQPMILEVDFHFPINTIGSREILVK